MAAARLSQVSGHLSGNYPRGLLKDEVAIITGTSAGASLTLRGYSDGCVIRCWSGTARIAMYGHFEVFTTYHDVFRVLAGVPPFYSPRRAQRSLSPSTSPSYIAPERIHSFIT